MGDEQHREGEELQQLAAPVDQACRSAAPTRPRSISEIRDALGGAGAVPLSAAEIITRLRAIEAWPDRDLDAGSGKPPKT